jgi:hypothetical protein
MEENVQRVFAVLISVIILFILPIYITFEKKDDLSYSLALNITSKFVENVTNNGYLSYTMYQKFVKDLAATDNIYDIYLEHKTKKYNPVIISYLDSTATVIKGKFDYLTYKDEYYGTGKITVTGPPLEVYENLVVSYENNEEIFNERHILDILARTTRVISINMSSLSNDAYKAINKDNIPFEPNLYTGNDLNPINPATNNPNPLYTLNKGDEFTVRIKNKNTSIATVLFNLLTFGAMQDNNTRVYINYGATVLNENYKDFN